MKARGIVIIDYDLPGGYRDAADEQDRLQEVVDGLVKVNPRVLYHEVDIRERRGNHKPDIKKMKLRVS